MTAAGRGRRRGFGAQWDAQFVHPVREVLIAPDDAHRHMGTVAHALTHHYNGDPFQRVIYTESHDEVANGKARIPHEIAPGDPAHWAAQKRSTLGAALVLTAPGIPMLFQGQEFLEGEWFRDTVPLDWDQSQDVPRHRPALARPDPAAARPRRTSAPGSAAAASRCTASTRRRSSSPSTAGTRAARATTWWWSRTSPRAARGLPHRLPAARDLAASPQHRLARL